MFNAVVRLSDLEKLVRTGTGTDVVKVRLGVHSDKLQAHTQ